MRWRGLRAMTLMSLPPSRAELRQQSIAVLTVGSVLDFRRPAVRRLWLRCYAPYVTWHFVVIPLLFLPLGGMAAVYVLVNKLLAEAITAGPLTVWKG